MASSYRFSSDQYNGVSKMDTLSLDVIKEHLGFVSSPLPSLPTSPLCQGSSSPLCQGSSQDMLTSSEWEDMESSQLYKLSDNNPTTQDGEVSVTLEEASQKILCDEVYRAPIDQSMDTREHSQDKVKQKRSHNSDSPRQPLRQINNTMQSEGRLPGPSKLSLNNRDQRTRVSKFND